MKRDRITWIPCSFIQNRTRLITSIVRSRLAKRDEQDAINKFTAELADACDMGDRRDAVRRLAKRIGHAQAVVMAEKHGLLSGYYLA